MNDLERKKWHEEERNVMVEKGSADWELATRYKKQHNPYSDDKIIIAEAWRDKDNFLCIRYTTSFGRELDWFHYTMENNELGWW